MDPDLQEAVNARHEQPRYSWGPWLFRAVLAGALVFFWWLLIYGHGVAQT